MRWQGTIVKLGSGEEAVLAEHEAIEGGGRAEVDEES